MPGGGLGGCRWLLWVVGFCPGRLVRIMIAQEEGCKERCFCCKVPTI